MFPAGARVRIIGEGRCQHWTGEVIGHDADGALVRMDVWPSGAWGAGFPAERLQRIDRQPEASR